MDLSAFRKRLISGELDQTKIALLKQELDYFNTIAPKSFLDRIKNNSFLSGLTQTQKTVALVLALVLIPLWIMLISIGLPFLMILLVILMFVNRGNQNPEYKNYDYSGRISLPTLRLFDEKLSTVFHFDSHDLVDSEMPYKDALVEAHLIKPIKKNCYGTTFSTCSYDWANRTTTDSFEFAGYKVSHEWTDSDGDRHEDIYFNGAIYKFRMSYSINGTVNIMSTNTTRGVLGGEKEYNMFKQIKDKDVVVIDTENHEFAENFDTIATYDEEAYRFLTPSMIENLLNLRRDYFFCICIKGNVMTVSMDKKCFKDATQNVLSQSKPYFAFKDSETELNHRICNTGKALLSIYELKDILDPGGRFIA